MNIVIESPFIQPNDINTLFGHEDVKRSKAPDLQSLMVELKIYSSKSQAQRVGRAGPIPQGWTVFKASKTVTLWIWNPSE